MKHVITSCREGIAMVIDSMVIREDGYRSPCNPLTRIWCLFEAWTALGQGVPVIIRMGSLEKNGRDFREESDLDFASQVVNSIDVDKAEATREDDIVMILDWIRASKDSVLGVNRVLVDATWGAFTSRGLAALHLAIQGSAHLFGSSVDLHAKNPEGWNALHAAASAGYTGAVECLLGAKAEIDALSNKDRTPAMMAAWRGHTGIVDILKKAGADLTLKDCFGTTMNQFNKKFARNQKAINSARNKKNEASPSNKETLAPHSATLRSSANNIEGPTSRVEDNEGFVTVTKPGKNKTDDLHSSRSSGRPKSGRNGRGGDRSAQRARHPAGARR